MVQDARSAPKMGYLALSLGVSSLPIKNRRKKLCKVICLLASQNPKASLWLLGVLCPLLLSFFAVQKAHGESAEASQPPSPSVSFRTQQQGNSNNNVNPAVITVPQGQGMDIDHEPAQVTEMEPMEVEVKSTKVIPLPRNVGQIFVTDPSVSDVNLAGDRTLYVFGRNMGETAILINSIDQKQVWKYDVMVTHNLRELKHLIAQVAPNQEVHLQSLPTGLLIQGMVGSAKESENIRSVVQNFVGNDNTVINQLKVKEPNQIQLKVKIAEVKRTVIDKWGVNWSAAFNSRNFQFGVVTGATTGAASFGGVQFPAPVAAGGGGGGGGGAGGAAASVPGFRPINGTNASALRFHNNSFDLGAIIDNLAQEDLATILAEPTLITTSGTEASFLAGGEIPIPVSQPGSSGSAPTVTISFKKYGVSLNFTPTQVGKTINLKVRPEVSEIDPTKKVDYGGIANIPCMRTRTVEATVELGNGQSLAMAGLLTRNASAGIDATPGLEAVPVLGPMFRSNDFNDEKTELVVVVTPYIVEGQKEPEIDLPGDGLKFAPFSKMILDRQMIETTTGTAKHPEFVAKVGFNY